jgi:hypothetical protein
LEVLACAISKDKTKMAISEKLDTLQRGPTVTIYNLNNAGSGQGGSPQQIFTYTEAKKQAVGSFKPGIY